MEQPQGMTEFPQQALVQIIGQQQVEITVLRERVNLLMQNLQAAREALQSKADQEQKPDSVLVEEQDMTTSKKNE